MSLFRALVLSLTFINCGCAQDLFSLEPDSKSIDYNPLFNSKVDILLVVDNSGSMDMHQKYLAASARDLAVRLVGLGFDFQLGVTSTDVSSAGERGVLVGNPKVLNSKTADLVENLSNRILLGSQGSSLEQGLEAAKLAMVADQNRGFLRADAFLLLFVLSNENDSSPASVDSYIDFFQQLKPPLPGRDRGWMLNFIGVTGVAQENCKTFGDYKDAGTRYMALAEYSQGLVDTICTASLSAAINNVENALLTLLSEISLSRQPIVDTIKVFFGGTQIPQDQINGWTYNPSKNSIIFHGNFIPRVATRIEVTFDPRDVK